jgi:hypothetical protein
LAHPVPVVEEVDPPRLDVDSQLLEITLRGEGFVRDSSCALAGRHSKEAHPSPRDTTYVSASELTVTLKRDDVAEAGSLSLTVFNPEPGGGVSEPVLLVVA